MHFSLGDDSTDGTIQYTPTDLTLTPELGGGVPYVAGQPLDSTSTATSSSGLGIVLALAIAAIAVLGLAK